jgi:hypothetical protein
MFGDRTNWLDTVNGQRSRRKKRDAVAVVAHAEVEPRSKNAITETEKQAVQEAFARGVGNRKGFRAPVAVTLDFDATANNPPEIHTVAKNYIDLARRAPAGRGRVFDDDRWIHYLAVGYTLKVVKQPSMFFRATRMSCFRDDVRLARRILRDGDRQRDLDDQRLQDDVGELRRWDRDRAHFVAQFGHRTFDLHRSVLLAQIQQRWLAGTERLLHSLLLDLMSGELPPELPSVELDGVRLPAVDLQGINREFLFSPSVSLPLGPLPRKSGENAKFKLDVEAALTALRGASPRLFPLLTELAVVILLVPPHDSLLLPDEHLGIDLDNLARKVIPRVHGILEPPTGRYIPDPATIDNARIRAFFEHRAKIARRLPKHHVTRYEVVAVPRRKTDPLSGSVRLVLCDGAEGRSFARFVNDTIDEWEEDQRW